MTVWPQALFSQCATWPPRAAVRQLSIARIALSWPRLTRPRLAWRQAAPWSRKISATSRNGRPIVAGRSARRLVPGQLQSIERAHHGAQHVGRDVGVARCRVQLGMSEQNLDNAHVGIALQQMRGEGMPERVRRHPRAQPCRLRRHVADAIELSLIHISEPTRLGMISYA